MRISFELNLESIKIFNQSENPHHGNVDELLKTNYVTPNVRPLEFNSQLAVNFRKALTFACENILRLT